MKYRTEQPYPATAKRELWLQAFPLDKQQLIQWARQVFNQRFSYNEMNSGLTQVLWVKQSQFWDELLLGCL